MKRRARVFVSGKVQGVFFRARLAERARELGVAGFVRNLSDGRVEAVMEGEEERVQQIIAWCHVGPPQARVDNVRVQWEDFEGEFQGFTVQRI